MPAWLAASPLLNANLISSKVIHPNGVMKDVSGLTKRAASIGNPGANGSNGQKRGVIQRRQRGIKMIRTRADVLLRLFVGAAHRVMIVLDFLDGNMLFVDKPMRHAASRYRMLQKSQSL